MLKRINTTVIRIFVSSENKACLPPPEYNIP